MNQFLIFIVRAVFSGVFAVIIGRMFRPEAGMPFIGGLTVCLLGASYLFEYFRKKRSDT